MVPPLPPASYARGYFSTALWITRRPLIILPRRTMECQEPAPTAAVGRESVMAGTDCGLGPRVGHAKIAWAKLEALTEGARLATRQLWGWA